MVKNEKEKIDKLINILKDNEYISYTDIVKMYGHTGVCRIDDMIKILVDEEYSSYEDVAKMYGTTRQAAYDIINMYNLKWYYNKHKIRIKDKLEKILKEERYSTYNDIEELSKLHKKYISRIISNDTKLYDLYKTNKVRKTNSVDKIKFILENNTYSTYKDIAKIYGCNEQYVGRIIKKYGLIDLYNKSKK